MAKTGTNRNRLAGTAWLILTTFIPAATMAKSAPEKRLPLASEEVLESTARYYNSNLKVDRAWVDNILGHVSKTERDQLWKVIEKEGPSSLPQATHRDSAIHFEGIQDPMRFEEASRDSVRVRFGSITVTTSPEGLASALIQELLKSKKGAMSSAWDLIAPNAHAFVGYVGILAVIAAGGTYFVIQNSKKKIAGAEKDLSDCNTQKANWKAGTGLPNLKDAGDLSRTLAQLSSDMANVNKAVELRPYCNGTYQARPNMIDVVYFSPEDKEAYCRAWTAYEKCANELIKIKDQKFKDRGWAVISDEMIGSKPLMELYQNGVWDEEDLKAERLTLEKKAGKPAK